MNTDLHFSLALLYAPSRVGLMSVLEHFPSLADLFSISKPALIAAGVSPTLAAYLRNPNWYAVEYDLRWAQQPECHLITWQDAAYPPLLKEIWGAPLVLFVKGAIPILSAPQLAIVGSRNPTPAGEESAFSFAKYLALSGLTITSGLALGIDGCSHRGALAGGGTTIAVMGTGLERIYPERHQALAQKIVESGGALVSEFSPKVLPKAENFPRRNRIISGLSMGVLVVEAALQSGSLITAKNALEQNREIFALPGSIHNPLARGCHRLLKQGAKLVEKADDILEELGPFLQSPKVSLEEPRVRLKGRTLDINQAKLVECVGFETTPIDLLVQRSGFSVDRVSSLLPHLELKGYIVAVPGGYMRSNIGKGTA